MGPDDDAQAGRVHELELPQVDDHELASARADLIERLLQLRRRGDVKLAGDGDQGRVGMWLQLDGERSVALCAACRTAMVGAHDVRRARSGSGVRDASIAQYKGSVNDRRWLVISSARAVIRRGRG